MARILDNSSFQNILSSRDSDILVEKGIAKEDILVKNFTIKSTLTIRDSKFKKILSFNKCKFDSDVMIISTNIGTSISFVDCEINGDLKFFQLKGEKAIIDILKSDIKGSIELDSIEKSSSFKFTYSTTNKIDIFGDISNNISEIVIQNSNITTWLKVQNVEKLKRFEISNTSVPVIVSKSINSTSSDSITFEVSDSIVDEFSIEKSCFSQKSILNVIQSKFNNLNIQNNVFKETKVKLTESLISTLLVIDGIKEENTIFDISTSTILNLKLGINLISFMSSDTGDSILLDKFDSLQRLKTLIILKNYFASEHLYNEEDKCFYMLKNEEKKYLLHKKNLSQKIFPYIGYLFNRYVFGWGVQVKNPVISSIVGILLFTIFFYFKLDLYRSGVYLEYINNHISGLYGAAVVSVVSFLGQYADVTFPASINSFIFIFEYIFGMILTTIIVGIIIRKLVR